MQNQKYGEALNLLPINDLNLVCSLILNWSVFIFFLRLHIYVYAVFVHVYARGSVVLLPESTQG